VHLDSAYVESFIRLYERHIAREEAELLPMASRLLGDDALNEIGKAMRERRGIASID
jgi:hemerythrin-like domain-containing protein